MRLHIGRSIMANNVIPSKFTLRTTSDQAILCLGLYPKEMKSVSQEFSAIFCSCQIIHTIQVCAMGRVMGIEFPKVNE